MVSKRTEDTSLTSDCKAVNGGISWVDRGDVDGDDEGGRLRVTVDASWRVAGGRGVVLPLSSGEGERRLRRVETMIEAREMVDVCGADGCGAYFLQGILPPG